jgi:large subunit ribosomal protein L32e
MGKKFIRTDYWRMSRIGARRKKLQVWRRARGKHSKMRRKRKGYPAIVEIGFKQAKKTSGMINGMIPILVTNLNQMEKIQKGQAIIISSTIGAKKRVEMIKKAESMKLQILNLPKVREAKK